MLFVFTAYRPSRLIIQTTLPFAESIRSAARFQRKLIVRYGLNDEIKRFHLVTVNGVRSKISHEYDYDVFIRRADFARRRHSVKLGHIYIEQDYVRVLRVVFYQLFAVAVRGYPYLAVIFLRELFNVKR